MFSTVNVRRASHLLTPAAIVLATVLVSATLLGESREVRPQAASTPPDVLPALLVEVRGLRAAMERMAEAGPRVQLALGRLQLQEQRVNTLVRRLEDVRTNLGQARRGLDQMHENAGNLERMIREAADPEPRRQAEEEVKALKSEVARVTLEVQRLTNDEAALMQEVSTEQGRWTEINQRLEELERTLGRR
jgi:DNA repair ATPase RecN